MGVDAFFAEIGEDGRRRLQKRLNELNGAIRARGIRSYQGQSDLLTGYSYGEFYDWDMYFENIYLSYYGIGRYCRANVEAFLDRQLACGFVARTLVKPRYRQHFKPFLAQTALLGARQSGTFEWLRGTYFDRLTKYLAYWFHYCDLDNNGLAVWDSADHSGMDNQDSRAGIMDSMEVEGVDLNCYLVRELRALSLIADRLGRTSDARRFDDHARRLETSINEVFWDENDGFYYDRNEKTGERVRVKSVAGFIPLWLGIVPRDRARRLVQEHLVNEKEFWLACPVASYAGTEPDYYQQRRAGECNWCGPMWVPTNYMIFHGLRYHGFDEIARKLAYTSFAVVLNEETTREYYNAETGMGQGLNPFWGWSSLAYLMPLEYELDYDPTSLETTGIAAIAREHLGAGISLE